MKPGVICLLLLFVSPVLIAETNTNSDQSSMKEQVTVEENAVAASSTQKLIAIPFKEEKTLSQQSTPVITVLVMFVFLAAAFAYFFKNKLSLVKVPGEKNIQVLEVKRLNARMTVFHIKVKNHEMMVLQSGDSIKMIDLDDKADSSVDA